MSHLTIPIAIGCGGFVGALARFYVSGAVAKASGDEFSFVGTLVVNLIGCFAIGVVWTVALKSTWLSPTMQKCVVTGLLGSLTTFSTFALESLDLLENGRFGAAFLNISANLVVGLLLVWLGMLAAGVFVADSSTAA